MLTEIFILALVLTTGVRLWLATRHRAHIAAHRAEVPQAFRDSIPLDAHQKAADYTMARVSLARADVVVSALWLLVLTLGGGLQWFYDLAGSLAGEGLLRDLVFVGLLTLASGVIDLPFTLYRTFVIEARFGFNKMTPAMFFGDLIKHGLVAAAIGAPVLAAVLWIMDSLGSAWWVYAWAFWLAFSLAAMLLYPTLIAPLFNKFEPMPDGELRSRIEGLLERCGFRADGLFVMDGSRRSAHGNAYFTGFGKGKRIVFFDTLLNRLGGDEIEAVLAHELGHYKHHHIWKRVALIGGGSLAFFALLGWLIDQSWFYAQLGVTSEGNVIALMLFALVMPVFSFPLSPIMSLMSRKHEFEADAYAAAQTRSGWLVSALVKLYRDNASTLTPDPLYSSFYDSHPPAALRVAKLQTL
ncbi:M48 family metallopeptidase [Methyloversatilis sp.]|uniref:M48 family metallopeptidase n=1 Tax=Methyloversatilis sp. TaxID=2569862 RepID=UPI002735A534|nr:M48 family metallopeptidase [Methyloversatilis sp.]MDP3289926.1 M48 family metallopeptidase [Methyloversatilis sp.]MDP3454186.1 M48 family metallopeptidase [Methyloversatilis sp.]MDP3578352.1 M48 family metallopeptidase [Methyloversatilis sp.]